MKLNLENVKVPSNVFLSEFFPYEDMHKEGIERLDLVERPLRKWGLVGKYRILAKMIQNEFLMYLLHLFEQPPLGEGDIGAALFSAKYVPCLTSWAYQIR